MEYINRFMLAMREQGIEPPKEVVADGTIHRFSTNGYRDDAAWYVLYDDNVPAGCFGDFRQNITKHWCSKELNKLSKEEIEQYNARIESAKKERQKKQADDHKKAAKEALLIWDAAEKCEFHPYLERKSVKSYGLRVGRWVKTNPDTGENWLDVPNALLVPITNGNKIVSLQAIFEDKIRHRNKDFLKGGKKKGCYYKLEGEGKVAYVCEGYSTAATIHEITKASVYIAFDIGNVGNVVEKAKADNPGVQIVIAADNDAFNKENTGVEVAESVAKKHSVIVKYPEFPEELHDQKPSDFNDLYRLVDSFEVINQLALPKYEVPEETTEECSEVQEVVNVNVYSPLPDVNSKGKPLSTIENLREICNRLGVIVRYNVVKKEQEILIPNQSFSKDNYSNASLAWITSWCARFNMPIGQVSDYLTFIADSNQFNPVCEWVQSKPWDGVKRFNDFLETVHAEDNELKNIFIKRWMLGAIDAAFNPNGVSIKGILVFQGAQDLGKTSWLLKLAPEELNVVKEGAMLDPKDRDSVKQCVSDWLVELGELDATFRKSDIAQLKAFIPRNTDTLRLPYARKDSDFSRRTVYFGTVNPREVLGDPTGNSRYWMVACTWIDYNHTFDMQQVWAELYEIYKSGERHHLNGEEQLMRNFNNEDFTVIDPVDERIRTKLDWDSDPECWRYMTTTEAMEQCGLDRANKGDVTRAANIIRTLNGGQSKRGNGKRLLLVPPNKPE